MYGVYCSNAIFKNVKSSTRSQNSSPKVLTSQCAFCFYDAGDFLFRRLTGFSMYSMWQCSCGKRCISCSHLNVGKRRSKWYRGSIPFRSEPSNAFRVSHLLRSVRMREGIAGSRSASVLCPAQRITSHFVKPLVWPHCVYSLYSSRERIRTSYGTKITINVTSSSYQTVIIMRARVYLTTVTDCLDELHLCATSIL